MNVDLLRLLGVSIFGLLFGWFIGHAVLCLALTLLLYSLWQYNNIKLLYNWLIHRKESSPPDITGLIDDICREINYLDTKHRKRELKLSGYLKRFEEATAALPDAIVILGEHCEIEWANSNAEKLLGIITPRDMRQRVQNLVRHPDISEFLNQDEHDPDRTLQIDSPLDNNCKLEFRIAPYGEKQKLLITRDVTQQFNINRMRKDFIDNASHELRTPLTVISGYLEGLVDDIQNLPEQVQFQISQMSKQAFRMQRLLDDMLNLSSLESDTTIKLEDEIPVPDMLTSIYQTAQSLSGIKDHIFYLETDAGLWIRGSRREIHSAFSNLVYNAVQYTPEKGIIKIRWYQDIDGAHFEVKDNGPGIAEEHIPRLTERFYRVDKGRSRDQGGTGLGLAIVKHVLGRYGVDLVINSLPGSGSTFRCDFPKNIIIRKDQDPKESLSA